MARLSYRSLVLARIFTILLLPGRQVLALSPSDSESVVITPFSDKVLDNEDLVRGLPGAPPHTFRQYAGYVTVNEQHGRRLFYWFVEAEAQPENKPLTLWLNGGPGCSSVGGGAMSELGPFYPSKDAHSLIPNEFSWNKESNIIFLESPAGVGFSYSDTPADYTTGDAQTAEDSRAFLLGWFKKFPQYKNRPFYISGESYAGHYIPDLAYLLWENRAVDNGTINLQGFLLGNPWTVTPSDFKGTLDFLWSRTIISSRTYLDILDACTVADYEEGADRACDAAVDRLYAEEGNINVYDVYVDVCTSGPALQAKRLLALRGLLPRKAGAQPVLKSSYDPCIDDEVETYLNLPAVQEALHAVKLPYRWTDCSDIVDYSLTDLLANKLGLWKKLLQTSLRMTVFSGDVDSVCPTMGTRDWIDKLEKDEYLRVSTPWYPWYQDRQVGGRTMEYNGGQFKFVTVRDAGHMVPYTQPARGLAVFRDFLHGNSMPAA